MFIVIEGIDGSGKSTLAGLLKDKLNSLGKNVVHVKDPGSTALGDKIRELLLFSKDNICGISQTLLFSAARAQLIHETIHPALKRGDIVILDRYIYSTYVYQKEFNKNTCIPDFVNAVEYFKNTIDYSISRLYPDLVIMLDISYDKIVLDSNDNFEKLLDKNNFDKIRGFYNDIMKMDNELTTIVKYDRDIYSTPEILTSVMNDYVLDMLHITK